MAAEAHHSDDGRPDEAPGQRACPLCGGAHATPLPQYSRDRWVVGACDACGFVYLTNPPGYDALVEEFAFEKTFAAQKKASRGSTPWSPVNRALRAATGTRGRNRTRRFVRWFDGGKVLDIGCGDGGMVPEPMVPFGIELSRALWELADAKMRARGGYCVHAPGADGIWQFPEGHFDGVMMRSYLEHETEVMKVLNGAFRVLKPGGKMFVRVPNFGSLNRRVLGGRWCGFRYPDHVNYFTTESLRRAAEAAGFRMRITNPVSLPVDDNINALFEKPQTARPQGAADDAVAASNRGAIGKGTQSFRALAAALISLAPAQVPAQTDPTIVARNVEVAAKLCFENVRSPANLPYAFRESGFKVFTGPTAAEYDVVTSGLRGVLSPVADGGATCRFDAPDISPAVAGIAARAGAERFFRGRIAAPADAACPDFEVDLGNRRLAVTVRNPGETEKCEQAGGASILLKM